MRSIQVKPPSIPHNHPLNEAAWLDWEAHAEKHVRFYGTVAPFGRSWKNDEKTAIHRVQPKVYRPSIFQDTMGPQELEAVWLPWFKKRPWKSEEAFHAGAWETRSQGALTFARTMAHLVSEIQHKKGFSSLYEAFDALYGALKTLGESLHEEWRRDARYWATPFVDESLGVAWVPFGVYQPQWNDESMDGVEVSSVFFTGCPGNAKGQGCIQPMAPYELFNGMDENIRTSQNEWKSWLLDVKQKWKVRHAQEKALYESATWIDVPSHSVRRLEALFVKPEAGETVEKILSETSKDTLPTSWWHEFEPSFSRPLKFGRGLTFDLMHSEKDMNVSNIWSNCMDFDAVPEDPRSKIAFESIKRHGAIHKNNLATWQAAVNKKEASASAMSETGRQILAQLKSEVERVALSEHVKRKTKIQTIENKPAL